MNARSLPKVNRERGVSLLEALITIVILAFGILGLANLHAKLQTVEVESYARSQALVLLNDMAARLSAHRGVAPTYVTTSPRGTGDTQPTDCSSTALGVARDTCEWSNALKGNTELSSGAAVGAMLGGRGCIEAVAGAVPPSYRVTVTWQGLSPTVTPGIDVGCAQSLYGVNDALRRAVVRVVSIAALGP
ncbi:MAG: type IV pilus modification protein PilV [Betaproteobacteria bacterium]|nr:MAG: type IV pilus modification protein PilV [Betaproteobacteria bacterium]